MRRGCVLLFLFALPSAFGDCSDHDNCDDCGRDVSCHWCGARKGCHDLFSFRGCLRAEVCDASQRDSCQMFNCQECGKHIGCNWCGGNRGCRHVLSGGCLLSRACESETSTPTSSGTTTPSQTAASTPTQSPSPSLSVSLSANPSEALPCHWHTSSGQRCKFPFSYQGQRYTSCAPRTNGHSRDWCALEVFPVTNNVVPLMWGDCDTCVPETVAPANPQATPACRSRGSANCLFPFVYQGVTYNDCTNQGAKFRWCPTWVVPGTRVAVPFMWLACDCPATKEVAEAQAHSEFVSNASAVSVVVFGALLAVVWMRRSRTGQPSLASLDETPTAI